jgi:phosphoribosylamine-glycine ligase
MRKGEVPSIEEDGKLTWNTGWCTAGDYLAIATGLGDGVEQAKKDAYQVVDKIHYPNKTYRNDIGDKVIKCLPKLHALGYAKGVHV